MYRSKSIVLPVFIFFNKTFSTKFFKSIFCYYNYYKLRKNISIELIIGINTRCFTNFLEQNLNSMEPLMR